MWHALAVRWGGGGGGGGDVRGMLLFEINFLSNQLFFMKRWCLLYLNPNHAPAMDSGTSNIQ